MKKILTLVILSVLMITCSDDSDSSQSDTNASLIGDWKIY